MQLPITSAPLYFLMDPDRKFVNFNQTTYPTIQVASVLNRATELPIIQGTSSAQPVWSVAPLSGTYSWQANPSQQVPGTPGIPGMTFAGAQFLPFNSLGAKASGTEQPFTMVSQANCVTFASGTAQTVWSFGSTSSATPKASLVYQSGLFKFSVTNSAGTFTASATADALTRTITCVNSGTTLTMISGGSVVATASITAAAETYNTFTIGALNSNGTTNAFFNGAIGKVLMYGGVADVTDVDLELRYKLGSLRG